MLDPIGTLVEGRAGTLVDGRLEGASLNGELIESLGVAAGVNRRLFEWAVLKDAFDRELHIA